MEAQAPIEVAKNAVTARSLFSALKENRIEVLLVIVIAHLLGISDRVIETASVCAF